MNINCSWKIIAGGLCHIFAFMGDVKEKVLTFLRQHNVADGAPMVVAVSGGVDSMVLLEVLRVLGYGLSACHVNHHTRGEENNTEEALVNQYCEFYCIGFHRYDLPEELKQSKENFHDTARNYRYQSFEKCRLAVGADYIVTAHHQDDSIENFFMYAIRGAGLHALSGIPAKRNVIIRPFSKVTKSDILSFVFHNNIGFIEDSSNLKNEYARNKIRNVFMPLLNETFSHQEIAVTQSELRQDADLIDFMVAKYSSTNSLGLPDFHFFDVGNIETACRLGYHTFKAFGFNQTQIANIMTAGQTGKIVLKGKHQLVRDRDCISMLPYPIKNFEVELTSLPIIVELHGQKWQISSESSAIGFQIYWPTRPESITIRSRLIGDRFAPESMKGATKTLKKYLNDSRVPLVDKATAVVVILDGEISGILGLELSHKSKMSAVTGFVLSFDRIND